MVGEELMCPEDEGDGLFAEFAASVGKIAADWNKGKAEGGMGKRGGVILEQKDPGMAVRALLMRARGDSFRHISRETGLTMAHVQGLEKRHREVRDRWRMARAQDMGEMQQRVEGVIARKLEILEKNEGLLAAEPLRDLARTHEIMGGQAERIEGMVGGGRSEEKRGLDVSTVVEVLRALEARPVEVKGEVVDAVEAEEVGDD
jgi:hypothetical protein